MALTRITTGSIAANTITADKFQNGVVQARHIQAGTIPTSALDANANTIALESRVNANLDIITGNVNTVQTNVVAVENNVVLVRQNVDSFGSFANTSYDTKANVSATFIQLNSNISVVQNNLAAVIDGTTAFTGQVTMNDDLVITGNLVVSGDTTTANSINMIVQDRIIMLANSASGTPADDVGFLFNRGDEGNAALFYDESAKTFKISDTKDPSTNTTISPVTSGNLDVGILTAAHIKYSGTDLHVSITDNVDALTTNINTLDANADAIEARRVANVLVAASNDFITFTRLNANINVVSGNVVSSETRLNANIDVVQDNVAALSGAVQLLPFTNVNVAVGSSNVFFSGVDTASDANVVHVSLDGIHQPNTQFVYNHSNNTIQFKDASIPSGTIVQIFTLT